MRTSVLSLLIISFLTLNLAAQKMKFITLKVEDSPIISFRIQFRVGSINEPKGKED